MRIQIRADTVHIDGYVNAVGRLSRRLTDRDGEAFKEQIEPGAFAKALEAATLVRALLNHDSSHILADTSGSLKLEEDSIGLHADLTSADPQLRELAGSGKLRGWSFGFIPLDSKDVYTSEGEHHIHITELDLKEVSVIDDTMIPCYAGTSINARAEAEKEVLYRAMDDDLVVRQYIAPDYSYYDSIIEKLRNTQI